MKHAPERYYAKKKIDREQAYCDMTMHRPDPKSLESFKRPAYSSERVNIKKPVIKEAPDDIYMCVETFHVSGRKVEKGSIYNYYQDDQIEFEVPRILLRQGQGQIKLLLSLEVLEHFFQKL